MLSAIFIILLDAHEPQTFGSSEDLFVLASGVGLIILVFILRRLIRAEGGGEKDKTNSLI